MANDYMKGSQNECLRDARNGGAALKNVCRKNEDLPEVAVVVSTYNGEKYIAEQLDSVLAQDYGNVSVYVRDDGSTDGTLEILRTYADRGDIELFEGNNVGVTESFFQGIEAVPRDVPFVALCDQDDVWHRDKLSRAVGLLAASDESRPLLYCSEYNFCDSNMNFTRKSQLNRTGVTFSKMLYENMCSGNTMVLNRALADRAVAWAKSKIYCHDWWIALVATCLGNLHYDERPTLEYRRLESSVSPTGLKGLKLLKYRLDTFLRSGETARVNEQLQRLYELFADEMDAPKRELLERFLNGTRLRKAVTPCRLRQKLSEEIALRAAFLVGIV